MSLLDQSHSVNMSGKIDLGFGTNGVVNIYVPGASNSVAYSVINGPNETLYVCGTATIDRIPKFFITALDPRGHIITPFGNNGYVIGEFGDKNEFSFGSKLILKDKKLLLLGSSYIETNTFPALAQLDLQGNFDPTFGESETGKIVIHLPGPLSATSGREAPDTFEPDSMNSNGTGEGAATLLDDGKILFSHYFFSPGTPSYGVIVRTLADGSLDTEFATNGVLSVIAPGFEDGQTQLQSVTVDSEGRYVACGSVFDLSSSPVKTFFARYSPEGKLDDTFGSGGFRIVSDPDGLPGGARAEALIPLEKGNIFSLGISIHGPYVGQLLKLDVHGQFHPDFNDANPLNTQLAESSTLWKTFTRQADDKLVVAGAIDQQKNSHVFDIVVARFDKTGKLDRQFNDGPGWARTRLSTNTDGALAMTLQPDKIVIAGLSGSNGVVVRYHG